MSDLRLGDAAKYSNLAAEAATAYLQSGTPLVTKIASIATRDGLNNEEIRRVCEGANHLVHQTLRQKTATVEFSVATFDKVASALGRDKGPAMVRYEKAAGVRTKTASAASVDPEDAWRERNRVRLSEKRASEAQADSDQVSRGQQMVAEEQLGEAKLAFVLALSRFAMEDGDLVKAAEDFATYPTLAEHPPLLYDVLRMTKFAGHRVGREVVFSDATMRAITPEGLKKTADLMDPDLYRPALRIGGQPVEVVSGNHQVWVALDTLVNQYSAASVTRGSSGRVNYERVGVTSRETADSNHEVGRVI